MEDQSLCLNGLGGQEITNKKTNDKIICSKKKLIIIGLAFLY